MVKPCSADNLTAWDQVSCYCERAVNPDFWAEPLNALSNLAFIVAAVMVYADLRTNRVSTGRRRILALIVLLMTVGVGSFLFHTYATVWSRYADIIPIAVFVAVYMALALNWFMGMGAMFAVVLSAVVVGATVAMFLFGTALNGSLAYAPALVSLLVVGTLLHQRRHGATDWVLSAFCVFALSLTFRTIDGWPDATSLGCPWHEAEGKTVALGTHALVYILNAVMLYLLLRAAILYPPVSRDS